MKIGILYIGIGKYVQFWDGFYLSCEKYFLPGTEKKYFVFSDQQIDKKNNIEVVYQKDLGWPGNTLFRYKMFLSHKEELQKFDYLFFFNGNTEFKHLITSEEFLPIGNENYLVCLSWHIYRERSPDEYPYERRIQSQAYIPFGEGIYYFQGGLNGGRCEEYLSLMEHCCSQIEEDKKNNILACFHDESHLNKYLLNKHVKVLSTKYGCPQEWTSPVNPKIIFRDKNSVLGFSFVHSLKGGTWWEILRKRVQVLFKRNVFI